MAKKQAAKIHRPGDEVTEDVAPSWDRFPGTSIVVEEDDDTETTYTMNDLPALAAEYLTLGQEVKEREARKKSIQMITEGLLREAEGKEVQQVRGDFFLASRYLTHAPDKISDTRLLEQGVEMEVIEAATVKGKEYYVTKITAATGE